MKLLEPKVLELSEIPILKIHMNSSLLKNCLASILIIALNISFYSLKLLLISLCLLLIIWIIFYYRYYLITRDKLRVITGICKKDDINTNYELSAKRFLKHFKLPSSVIIENQGYLYRITSDKDILQYDGKEVVVFVHPSNAYEYENYIQIRNVFFISSI